jgi:hypothetical protein
MTTYNSFIQELQYLRREFLFQAKHEIMTIDRSTFSLRIEDGYILMSVEGRDSRGKQISASTHITHATVDTSYHQKSIRMSKIEFSPLYKS